MNLCGRRKGSVGPGLNKHVCVTFSRTVPPAAGYPRLDLLPALWEFQKQGGYLLRTEKG